ncbi:MAG: sulfatase-like hydrolase/transferase [Verrucomicrobiales bacterium]
MRGRQSMLAAGGLRFTQAFLTASSCSPSRASLITGRYPHNNTTACELHAPIPAHLPWLPEVLRQSGYYTALVGKNHMRRDAKTPPERELWDLIDNGNSPATAGRTASEAQVVRDRPQDKPFFFWFAAIDAHRDWDADRQWDAGKYGSSTSRRTAACRHSSPMMRRPGRTSPPTRTRSPGSITSSGKPSRCCASKARSTTR